MAHKKGQGTSRNGRDSNAQRLGFKDSAGRLCRRHHHVRQRGNAVKPGSRGRGKDDTLSRKSRAHQVPEQGQMGKFVMVEPVEIN